MSNAIRQTVHDNKDQFLKQGLFLQNIGSGYICQKILIVEADRHENFHLTASLTQFLKNK